MVRLAHHERHFPFNPAVFPYSEASPTGQDLYNLETDNTLKISQSDTLLVFKLGTTDLQTVSNLGKDFQTYVLEPLRKICGVSRIARYGMLVRFDEKSTIGLQRPTVRYKDPDLPDPKDFGLRFSHRLPTTEGYIRKNVGDYRNLIYTFFENSTGQSSLNLDYQENFLPMLEASEWGSHPFPSFVDEGILYHRTTFTKWIEKLRKTEQAA